MGETHSGSAGAAAVRAAHEVSARRAEHLKQREAEIAHVLADYFEAKAHAEKLRTSAQVRAGRLIAAAEAKASKITSDAHASGDRLTEQAELDAAGYDALVGAAVRHLVEMGESRGSEAEMTGLSQAVIRSIERAHSTSEPGPDLAPEAAASARPARNTRKSTPPVPD